MSRTRTTKEEVVLARRALRAAIKHLDRAANLSHLRPTPLQAQGIQLTKDAACVAAHLAAMTAEYRDMTKAEARGEA